MKSFTLEDIRSWDPCYDPGKYLPAGWSGTVMHLLKMKQIPLSDVLWVASYSQTVSEKTLRLFAVWCARQVEYLMTDRRSITALDVAEKFANGHASEEELDAAHDASHAVWAASQDVAIDVVYAAARAADAASCELVFLAAWSASQDAADAAAYAADLADFATHAAVRTDHYGATHVAHSIGPTASSFVGDASVDHAAAWEAASAVQRDKLMEMIEAEEKE